MENDGLFIAKESAIKAPPMKRVAGVENAYDEIEIYPTSSAELSQLETLPEPLRSLCKRIVDARWGEVAVMTQAQIAEAMKLKLAHGGLSQLDMFKALPLMKEWFDRQLGKAAQSIAVTVEDKPFSKMTTDRLLALEQSVSRALGEESVVILPVGTGPHA